MKCLNNSNYLVAKSQESGWVFVLMIFLKKYLHYCFDIVRIIMIKNANRTFFAHYHCDYCLSPYLYTKKMEVKNSKISQTLNKLSFGLR